MDKKNILLGKIQSSGSMYIQAQVNQNKKTGKANVKNGTDLRSGGRK